MTPATTLRWGLGAFFAAWCTGLGFAIFGGSVVYALTGAEAGSDDLAATLAGLVAQTGGAVLAAWVVSTTRGQASLRRDFGFELRRRDGWWLLVGVALQIGTTIVLIPLALLGPNESQGVVEAFTSAAGLEVLFFALAVVVLAPLAEELLFRGMLLRALLRLTTPGVAVLASSAVFASVHLVLDPSVGSAQALPALALLGVVAADQAVRTRSLSRPFLLHAGFNLLTAVRILAA